MKNKVFLGTVKFGVKDYGFSSLKKQSNVDSLLALAHKCKIDVLDTSPRYGNSEDVIGEYHAQHIHRFRVCTKVDNLEVASLSSERKIFQSVVNSIRSTGVDSIEILYLHQNEMEIIRDEIIINALQKVKEVGLVKKIGVSIYNAEECRFALANNVFDVIQLPVNILDSSIYANLIHHKPTDKEIIARSIFLQGLLFNRKDIKNKIKQWKELLEYISKLDDLAYEYNIDLPTMACSFVSSLIELDGVIVGTGVEKNLTRIIKASRFKMTQDLHDKLMLMSRKHKDWANPRNW